MKEIFESYKTPELRFIVKQHNQKVRKIVREDVKELRKLILSKRLIDLRYKKRPEIIEELLKNKQFFKNLKKRPDNFNIKKSKVVEIKAQSEKPKEMPKEKPKEKPKPKKEDEETQEEKEERLKALRKRVIAGRKRGKKNPIVKKLGEGKESFAEVLKRLKKKGARQAETLSKLIEIIKTFSLTERERKGFKDIELRVEGDSADEKDLEKLKRLIKKYSE